MDNQQTEWAIICPISIIKENKYHQGNKKSTHGKEIMIDENRAPYITT